MVRIPSFKGVAFELYRTWGFILELLSGLGFDHQTSNGPHISPKCCCHRGPDSA